MKKSWRHVDFLGHRTILTGPVPRVSCPSCGIRQAEVPWARPKSGYTYAFEFAVAELLSAGLSQRKVAEIVDESRARLRKLVDRVRMDDAVVRGGAGAG